MKEFNKNNPFKTPEGYFENFSERLLDKLSEEKHDLPKEDGFTAPDDYFDGILDNIQQKLNAEETKVVQLHPYKKYYLAAASIAAVLLVFFGLNSNTETTLTFEDLASTDIEDYFDAAELGLSSYEIAEVIPLDELEINDILETNLEEENIINYLDENINAYEELNIVDDE